MGFLNSRRPVGRHAKMNIVFPEHFAHLATTFAGQRNDTHVGFVRRLDRFNDIARIARGGNRQQHIAGMTKAAHLLGENEIEAVIVADSGQNRAVGSQRNRRQFLPLGLETANQLCGKMLGIAG